MLDLLIIFILLITSVIGFFRGFNKEIRSLMIILIFVFISYYFIGNIEEYIKNFITIPKNFYPNYLYPVTSVFIIYVFSVLIIYFVNNLLLSFSLFSKNILLNKFLGVFIGLFKGFVYIMLLILMANYYSFFEYFINFDKNSLFLDYFLKYGVQLNNVWNHWNS